MNKIMSRCKGLIFSCMSMILIVACVCSFSLNVKASSEVHISNGHEFYVNYPEPPTSSTQGYLNIVQRPSNGGAYSLQTYFWNCVAVNSETEIPAFIDIDLTKYDLDLGVTSYSLGDVFYVLYEINANGDIRFKKSSSSSSFYTEFSGTAVAWRAYGNCTIENAFTSTDNFTVYYSDDGSTALLMEVIGLLNNAEIADDYIMETLHGILNSVDGVENQLSSVCSYLKSINNKLTTIEDDLEAIYDKLDEILEEEKKQTSWLEKIWNSIQEFFNPDTEDKETTEQFQENSSAQSDKMNELNQQNKTEKEDIGSASSSVDSNVDLDSIENYGGVLAVITEKDYILQILLLVFSVALVGYVLFGKR